MENKSNHPFDKMQYLKLVVSQFINKESIEDVDKVYFQLVNNLPTHLEQNQIKRNIIEKCRDLFRSQNLRETIANAGRKGVTKSVLISIAVEQLALVALGRHYDMSNLCCEGMVSSVITDSEIAQKNSSNKKEDIPAEPIEIKDLHGNRILIKYLDTINYKSGTVYEYIKLYKITRYVGEKPLPPEYVYTDLDFSRLSPDDQNTEYYRAVANHLLSIENIKYSNAHGYIGGLTNTSTSTTGLKVGEEYFETEKSNRFSSYTYQISPNQALYFDRMEKEAVIAYLEKTKKREENDGR